MSKIPKEFLAKAVHEAFAKSGLPTLLDAEPEEFVDSVMSQDILRLHEGLRVPSPVESEAKFRSRDIEPLVQQATGLMLQAISDRSAWQAAGEKWANLVLQLLHDWRYLGASAAGIKSIAHSITSRQHALDAEKARLLTQGARAKGLASLADRADPNGTLGNAQARRTRTMEYGKAGFGLSLHADLPDGWHFDAQPLSDEPWSSEAPNDRPVVYDGATRHLPDLFRDLGERAQRYSLQTAYQATLIESATAEGDATASQHASDAITSEIESLKSSLDAAKRRRDSDEEVLALKVIWTMYDDLLGFFQQAASGRSRYQLSAGAAFARMQAAAIGLKDLYGYAEPLPQLMPDSVQSFDAVYRWLVGVIDFLAARERTSQEVTLRVSVKTHSNAGWPKQLGVGSQLVFDVSSNDAVVGAFLRGASVEVADAADLSGRMMLVLERTDGKASCVVSEIRMSSDPRPVRIHGDRLLFNALPFGEWRLSVAEVVGTDKKVNAPDDIFVNLHLCVGGARL